MNKVIDKGSFIYQYQEEILIIDHKDIEIKFYGYNIHGDLKKIQKSEYFNKVIGSNYKLIEQQLCEPIEYYQVTKDLSGNIYLSTFRDNKIIGFNEAGKLSYEWIDKISKGHSIYDIKFQSPNYLWIAYPSGQTVSQIHLKTGNEIFRIGEYSYEAIYEPLSYPESLFIDQEYLYIPNMGNKKLFELNLNTYELKLKKIFEEKIWQYLMIGKREFVLLESGIYEI